VCEIRKSDAAAVCERAGEFFLAQRLFNLYGVLNIAEAAVFPFFSDGTQAVLKSTFARQLLLNFS
jgi:hypothetical protein